MSKNRLEKLKERCLRAIKRGIDTTDKLYQELDTDTAGLQTVIRSLIKDTFIRRVSHGKYLVTPQGEEGLAKKLPGVELPFGDKDVQTFLKQFPEPFRGVIRLSVSAYVAKQSKLFEQDRFDGAFPGTVLVGDPGLGKTPIGQAVCELQGLKFTDHKIDVDAITKGEFGGRPVQVKGSRFIFEPSYWFKLGYLQIEEPGNIINREVSNLVRFILHGDKTYKREGEDFENRVVPFSTLNLPTKEAETVMEKIVSVKGLEPATIKRNNVLFCNPSRGLLGDPYLFFGRVMENVPKINFNFPVIRFRLDSQEKTLLIKLIHRAMQSDKVEYSYCDKRGLEIMILGHFLLTGNQNVVSSIFQITRDRLQCLESLGLVREGWRDALDTEMLEHEGTRNPEKEKEIRELLEDEARLKDKAGKEKEDKEKADVDKLFDFEDSFEEMLDNFRSIYDFLTFPLSHVEGARLTQTEKENLCRRWRKKTRGRRKFITRMIENFKSHRTEEALRIGKATVRKVMKEKIEPIGNAFRQEWTNLDEAKGVKITTDKHYWEDKATVVDELTKLKQDLYKGEDWKVATTSWQFDAIRILRRKSEALKSHLGTLIKRQAKRDLPYLTRELNTARGKAKSWLEQYEKDKQDPGTKLIGSFWDWILPDEESTSTPQRGEAPPAETVKLRGHPDEGILEDFGYKKDKPVERPGERRVRGGKTFFQRWLEKRNKKKGKPKPPGASGGGIDQDIQRKIDSGEVGGGIDFDPTQPGG